MRSATLWLSFLAMCLIPHSFAAAAPGSGTVVVRFQDQVGFFIVDDATGLMSFHGTSLTFAQICSGGGVTFENLDIQLLLSPAGPLHALFTSSSHPVVIYPSTTLPDPHHIGLGDCPILAGLVPVASGTARLVRTDNDLLGSGSRANAFGWTSSGTLTETGIGRALKYSETVRAVMVPGAVEPSEVRTSIRLTPGP